MDLIRHFVLKGQRSPPVTLIMCRTKRREWDRVHLCNHEEHDDGDPFNPLVLLCLCSDEHLSIFNDPLSEKAPRSIASLGLFQRILRKRTETRAELLQVQITGNTRKALSSFPSSPMNHMNSWNEGIFRCGDLRRLLMAHHLPQPSFFSSSLLSGHSAAQVVLQTPAAVVQCQQR